MENIKTDICIIGAGASGLAAAVSAGGLGASVFVAEKKNKIGSKIAASGNGRCNMSNASCSEWPETKAFFEGIGLYTMEDSSGRIYPHSEDAKDVIKCLERAALRNRVRFALETCCKEIAVGCAGEFRIGLEGAGGKKYTVTAKRLILAAGGKSAPKLGTSGDGYILAKALGHNVTKLIPSLTAVETKENIKALGLSGIRAKCKISLSYRGEERYSEIGEVQFTDYGLSGICIMNASSFMTAGPGEDIKKAFSDMSISLDFVPELSADEARILVTKRLMMTYEDEEEALCSIVKSGLARVIAGKKISGAPAFVQLKNLTFRPKGLKGWDYAQVTKGGVSLEEIDKETQESKIVKGLYVSGEVLDYDGLCGGFNLQNAWTTGVRAGIAAAKSL